MTLLVQQPASGCILRDRAGDAIAALFLVLAGWFVVGPWLPAGKPADPFRAKYERVRAGMSLEEVTRLLGPPDGETNPGGSLGDHVYHWADEEGRLSVVTWNVVGEYADVGFVR
jgi:hypothetical protein